MNRLEVGNRLRGFLKEKYGKLAKGADALGMSPSGLQMYLTGKRLPGSEMISKLKSLGCDTDWLLLVKNSPGIYPTHREGLIMDDDLAVKDKTIISQAQEIQELKQQLKRLKEKILSLEKESDLLSKEVTKKTESRSEKSNPKRRKITSKVV